MNRQQTRCLQRKTMKRALAQARRDNAKVALDVMRAARARNPNYQTPKIPGKLLTSRRPYAKARGKDSRSVLSLPDLVMPAITARVGRRTLVIAAERRYERSFHYTKGHRCVRVAA
jgi:hypothetical protein